MKSQQIPLEVNFIRKRVNLSSKSSRPTQEEKQSLTDARKDTIPYAINQLHYPQSQEKQSIKLKFFYHFSQQNIS